MSDSHFVDRIYEIIGNNKIRKISSFILALNNYLKFLENFASKIKTLEIYRTDFQDELNRETSKFIDCAISLEKELDLSLQKKIRELFREIIGKYIFQSKILKRFYKKPQGYAGDFLMFDMMYNQKILSKGIGYYFDGFTLNYPFVKDMIVRKIIITSMLNEVIMKSKSKEFRITNIGSGPCRELIDLFGSSESIQEKVSNLTLIDQDVCALNFAEKKLSVFRKVFHSVQFVQRNMYDILGFSTHDFLDKLVCSDLVYSIGVSDYFFPRTFERFIGKIYEALKPGGIFIFACCSSRFPYIYTPLRWFTEWNFYYRNEKKVREILSFLHIKKAKIVSKKNSFHFFVSIKK